MKKNAQKYWAISASRLIRASYAVCAILMLLLPTFDSSFKLSKNVEFFENRTLHSLPEIPLSWNALEKFPANFDEFFKDNFGWRRLLIKLYSFYEIYLWHKSPNHKVLLGNKHWLYFTGELEQLLDYPTPFTALELHSYTDTIATLKNWYEQQGIKFFIAVAPNKQTLYPEHLPMPQSIWSQLSNYNQLLTYYRQHADDQTFIDLKEPLLAQKAAGNRVYYQTDSHWNEFAAFIAYSTIISKIAEHIDSVPKAPSLAEFNLLERQYCGDLVTLQLGLKDLLSETTLALIPKFERLASHTTIEHSYKGLPLQKPLELSENPAAPPLKAIVLRDSQFIPIIPNFSEHFSHVLYIDRWEDVDVVNCIIEREKPNVVLHESVERGINGLARFKKPEHACTITMQ